MRLDLLRLACRIGMLRNRFSVFFCITFEDLTVVLHCGQTWNIKYRRIKKKRGSMASLREIEQKFRVRRDKEQEEVVGFAIGLLCGLSLTDSRSSSTVNFATHFSFTRRYRYRNFFLMCCLLILQRIRSPSVFRSFSLAIQLVHAKCKA